MRPPNTSLNPNICHHLSSQFLIPHGPIDGTVPLSSMTDIGSPFQFSDTARQALVFKQKFAISLPQLFFHRTQSDFPIFGFPKRHGRKKKLGM